MPGDYDILSRIHKEIQLSEFAKQMTGHLLDYAQRHEWMGRQIVDVGCGTGEGLLWLAQHGYIVTGVDQSPEMLQIARQNLHTKSMQVQLLESDFRKANITDQDMVLALNVLNELNNIRELEQAFQRLNGMLRKGKWLVFDMYTIEGLYMRNQTGYHLEHDSDGLTIFIRNSFDYEKSIQTRDYIIFREQESGWQRQEAQRILRAYPIQAMTALVQRSGFKVGHVLNMNMTEHNPNQPAPRVLIFAEKQ